MSGSKEFLLSQQSEFPASKCQIAENIGKKSMKKSFFKVMKKPKIHFKSI
jgi:hypothetical protein